MAFDPALDKVLGSWKYESLEVSLRSYNGGDRKLQIGPRSRETKSGDERFEKARRLSVDEIFFLKETVLPEVEKLLEE